jgi:sigma-B regulation protein RsbU (phosphoserine phosphatase)
MPSAIPQLPGLRIAATCRPARIAGGDYFDVLKLGAGTAAICIADVCGKGMPAAMVMSSLQASVKSLASTRMSPAELCKRVNRVMCSNLAGEGFVSFFYAVIEPGEKRLTCCNAGHNPPILVSGNSVRYLQCGGGILGVMEQGEYEEDRIQLRSGDRLLLYTDGITESRNTSGEEFGEKRLSDLTAHLSNSDATALLQKTIDAVSLFNNTNFEDDVTVVAVSID